MKLKSPDVGKAGELRVRSELLIRGFSSAVFDQDNGIDIILSNGKKIQVKTSMRPSHTPSNYSYKYSFSIRQTQFRNSKGGLYERSYTRKDYSECDYFIFWCVEDDIFYIIPVGKIGGKISLTIPTPLENRTYRTYKRNHISKYEQYKNNWEVLND